MATILQNEARRLPESRPCGGASSRVCEVSMATILQNEARWLPEWLEYNLAIGFGHFYIYDDSSHDELAQTLAPYRAGGSVTLTHVSELGVLPTTRVLPLPPRNCTQASALQLPMWWDEQGRCVAGLHFPQQVGAARHAVAAYGHLTKWLAFFDVDEFIAFSQFRSLPAFLAHVLLHPAQGGLARSATAAAVGGVRLPFTIVLPHNLHDYTAPTNETLLLDKRARQAAPPVAPAGFFEHKCILRMGHAAPLDELFGSIHRLSLAPGSRYYLPHRGEAQLAHYRYRTMHTFASRLNKTYMSDASPGGALKRRAVQRWKAQLLAWQKPGATVAQPDVPLLRFVADVHRGIAHRWDPARWAGPVPRFVAQLRAAVAAVASRRSVLLVSEARSGATSVSQLAFNARRDFLYLYEPCRLLTAGQGLLHNASCARFAIDALSCRLSAHDFGLLERDRSFVRFSAAGRGIAAKGADARGKLARYSAWLDACWTSHRAAQVIRMAGLAVPEPAGPVPLGLSVVHLVRNPVSVASSRARLAAFMLPGPLNPTGDLAGVVGHVCAGMRAKLGSELGRGGAATPTGQRMRRVRFEDFMARPAQSLAALYEWLGVPPVLGDAPQRRGLGATSNASAAAVGSGGSAADGLASRAFLSRNVPSSSRESRGHGGQARRPARVGSVGLLDSHGSGSGIQSKVEAECADVLRGYGYE